MMYTESRRVKRRERSMQIYVVAVLHLGKYSSDVAFGLFFDKYGS